MRVSAFQEFASPSRRRARPSRTAAHTSVSPGRPAALLRLLLPLALLTAVARPAPAQWPGEARGRIRDALSGDPVSGATVTVRESGRTVESDGRGRFEIRGLEPGPAVLEVSALGYEPGLARVDVENGR
ncbi:MAG TPA: carboxypeptidase regulatory-like domain-containing protein, partial [Longimicrobiales bacterium]|nr:carboxypeptidase regulatory-like domain-containing protein [Longimicrobiales bacterium]